MQNSKKLIDVSGTGHSGHSAVMDFLNEFEGVHAHYALFHFELFRQPGGLCDLILASDDNWSEISFDFNVKKFLRLVEKLAPACDKHLGPNFEIISQNYIQSILEYELHTDWFDSYHFDFDTENLIEKFKRANLKVLSKALPKSSKQRFASFKPKHTTYHISPQEFKEKTSKYIFELLFHDLNNDINYLISGNAIDPYKRSQCILDVSDSIYSIIVVRDPRDIYASLFTEDVHKRDFESNDSTYSFSYLQDLRKSFLGADDVKKFVQRQKLTRSRVSTCHKQVLLVEFEELIKNYDEVANRILKFVGIQPADHIHKFKKLDPNKSKKNIGLWKTCSKTDEIKFITENLKEYLHHE